MSSNDENYEYNDYPDEEEVNDNECDFYRDWEEDEERELRQMFEKNQLSDNDLNESDSDYYKFHKHSDESDDSCELFPDLKDC